MGFLFLRSQVAAGGGGGEFTPFRVATFEFGTNGGTPINATDGIDSTEEANSTVDTTRAYAGTKSMRCRIAAAATRMGGYMSFPSVNNGGDVASGDEFWWRARIYIPTSWDMGTGDGGMKFFRMRCYGAGGVPLSSNTVQLWGAGPAPSGLRTEAEGDTPNTQTFTPAGGWNDRWVTFEFYIKLDTGSSGILRSWVDGTLRGEVTGVNTVGSTAFLSLVLHFLDFFNNGAPQQQDMWIDNIDIAWSGDASPTNQDLAGNFYMGMD